MSARGSHSVLRNSASLQQLAGHRLRIAEANARRELWQAPTSAGARAVCARAHFDRGDDWEALRLLQQARYDDPNHDATHALLVDLLAHLGKHAEVSAAYTAWALSVFRKRLATPTTNRESSP